MKRLVCFMLVLTCCIPALSQERILFRFKHEKNFRVNHVRDIDVGKELKRLLKREDIAWAEIDKKIKPEGWLTLNDPSLSQAWHINKISANLSWDTGNGNGVVIAILDTGINTTHPDLAANCIPGWNYYNNNSDTTDVHGHGTGTAGTAAAVGNNSLGSAGIAYSAKIFPGRIGDDTGYASYSTAATALRNVADRGIKVANISYEMTASSAVSDAAKYFQEKGGVVTISSGNSGLLLTGIDNPYILTVAATESNDSKATWSNYGGPTDLFAPGGNIYATTRSGYGSWSGTSFSAPIVAGVAAIAISTHPGLTGQQYYTLVKQSTDLVVAGNRINANKAAIAAIQPPPPVPVDTIAPSVNITYPISESFISGKFTMAVNIAAADNVKVTKVELYVDGSLVGTDISSPWSFTVNTKRWVVGEHTLTARAYDAALNVGVSSSINVFK